MYNIGRIFFALLPFLFFILVSCVRTMDGSSRRHEEMVSYQQMEGFLAAADEAVAKVEVFFEAGKSHNHPLMAIWLEDMEDSYLQTLYVASSIGQGVFRHGDPSEGFWKPGPVRRPAALPYWGHQRGVQAPDGYFLPTADNPMPDAITGPTPRADFVLLASLPGSTPRQFRILLEINQSWDWNHYWTNDKYPGDEHYMTSSQPALVYEATIDLDHLETDYEMLPIGHSHWSGRNGQLYPDLSTITTALDIAGSIRIVVHH